MQSLDSSDRHRFMELRQPGLRRASGHIGAGWICELVALSDAALILLAGLLATVLVAKPTLGAGVIVGAGTSVGVGVAGFSTSA